MKLEKILPTYLEYFNLPAVPTYISRNLMGVYGSPVTELFLFEEWLVELRFYFRNGMMMQN